MITDPIKTMKELIKKDELKVKEDKYGNLIITFTKDVLMEKGSHIYVYKPFTSNNNERKD